MDRDTLISVEAIRTLAHVALLAAVEGQIPAADRILVALETLRPKESAIQICRAMLLTQQEKFVECLALLKNLAKDDPENQIIKSILGFVMFMTGDVEWKPLLKDVIDHGSDPASVELAQMIMAEGDEQPRAAKTAPVEGSRQFIRYA